MKINVDDLRQKILKSPPEKTSWVMRITCWRKVSFCILKFIISHDMKLSPNIVTFFSLLFGLLIFIVSFIDNYYLRLLAIPLWYLAALLDHLDGDLARATNKTSRIGQLFDSFGFTLAKIYLIVFPLIKALQVQASMYIYLLGLIQLFILYSYDEAQKSFMLSVVTNNVVNTKNEDKEIHMEYCLRRIIKVLEPLFIIDSRALFYLLCVIIDNYIIYFYFNNFWCFFMILHLSNCVFRKIMKNN